MSGKRIQYISTIPSVQPADLGRAAAKPASRSFVPADDPDAAITPARVEILPPATAPEAPAPPMSNSHLQTRATVTVAGSHVDRAAGFVLAVNRLGLTLGSLGIIVAVAGLRAPLFSLVTLAWFGGLYAGAWLLAYLAHVFVSTEGAAWWHVVQGWRWLGREQAHRHRLERYANGLPAGHDPRPAAQRRQP